MVFRQLWIWVMLLGGITLVPAFSGTAHAEDPVLKSNKKETIKKIKKTQSLGQLTGGSLHVDEGDTEGHGIVIDNANLKELGAKGTLSKGGRLYDEAVIEAMEDAILDGREDEDIPPEISEEDALDEKAEIAVPSRPLLEQIKSKRRSEAKLRREMIHADPKQKELLRQQIQNMEEQRRALEAQLKNEKTPP